MTPEITVGMPGDPSTSELAPPPAAEPEPELPQAASARVLMVAAASIATSRRESESLAMSTTVL